MALFILVCTLISISLPVNAATAGDLEDYGFQVPTTGFTYTTWFNRKTIINIYAESGRVLIGRSISVVARARRNTIDSSGYYHDILFIRTQMEPKVTRYLRYNYYGLNYQNKAVMTLNSNQDYVNYAPQSTMPESSSTWNVSLGMNINSNRDFGFSLDTGYSSTTQDYCYTISTSIDSLRGKYNIAYNYSPISGVCWPTAARKAINKWCTEPHQCYYAFAYRTPSGNNNTNNMVITHTTSFRYACATSNSWNGNPSDISIWSKPSGSETVLYVMPN